QIQLARARGRVEGAEGSDRSAQLVRRRAQRLAVAGSDRLCQRVNLRGSRLDEQLRQIANKPFVAVFAQQEHGIKGRHARDCTQSSCVWSRGCTSWLRASAMHAA